MPFVAGPSGHTATLMTGAMKLGLKTQEELKEYALACFVFLAAAGNHSLHEVMTIARQAGVAYIDGNYASCLPKTFAETDIYRQLEAIFPQFVTDNDECDAEANARKNSYISLHAN